MLTVLWYISLTERRAKKNRPEAVDLFDVYSAGGDEMNNFIKSIRDLLWFIEIRLPDIVLVLLAVLAPVAFTTFAETATFKPPEPNDYCVRYVGRYGHMTSVWTLCFAADFGAQWYRNFVEFPAAITADCEMVSNDGEKQSCADRRESLIEQFSAASVAALIGFAVGSRR